MKTVRRKRKSEFYGIKRDRFFALIGLLLILATYITKEIFTTTSRISLPKSIMRRTKS